MFTATGGPSCRNHLEELGGEVEIRGYYSKWICAVSGMAGME